MHLDFRPQTSTSLWMNYSTNGPRNLHWHNFSITALVSGEVKKNLKFQERNNGRVDFS